MEKCKERIWGDVWSRPHQCKNNAKKDGYCMMHHPDTKSAKEKAWRVEYERKKDLDPLRIAHKQITKIKQQRDELLAALKASLEYYRLQSQPKPAREILKMMRETIAKAEGRAE